MYQSSHGSTPNFASFTSCYMYKLSQHAFDLHFCYQCYFTMVMLLSILGLPPIIEVLIQQKISFQDQESWKGVKNNWSTNFQIQSSKKINIFWFLICQGNCLMQLYSSYAMKSIILSNSIQNIVNYLAKSYMSFKQYG